MTLKRACSLLTVKSFSEDERVITGIASTPSPDRDGDILGAGGRGVWQCDPVSLAA
ncbi:head protein [Escherichia coli]|uniref:head protein n=1 Tax=Escherichia coli TaxID=562 RepID=UPI0021C1AEDB|nr:head protein [Escherichia coli]UXJ30538.1 head protein [Escherichia coli]